MKNYITLINKYINDIDNEIDVMSAQRKIKGFDYDHKVEMKIKELHKERYDLDEIRMILLRYHVENEVT